MSTDAVPRPTSGPFGASWNGRADTSRNTAATSPRLDAEVLLAHARAASSASSSIPLMTRFCRSRFAPENAELVKRRTSAEPVAYLVGMKEFYSLPLK